ncbi:fibroblast growth factor receptor homolog 1-like [Paramacrobiotus metropolitanus]|uniref:fibroblast growth factor receptor homolog 1-like n=1 Tax=Paramacrobiotus metropolitanus TaxID=2943436 RepID=UPI0024458A35|nr:fibroblast growth factor receptor homolog 1-like [Paramacrobiotus metropolitanus]
MATFMRVGRHPNIVNLIAVVLKGRPMIVMEYCPHGSLYQYLQNLKADNAETEITADVDFLLSKLQQIAIGMAFLTTRGILHRDLAARNVLLDDNLTAKISDFGLARARSEYILQRPNIKLPLGWMAPETLIPGDGRYSEKSDVWSFGVITWECFTYGQTPYSQSFPLGLDVDGLSQFLLSGQRLILPETCPDWMRALVADCWSWEVSGRLSFKEIVSLMGKYSKVANPEEEIETL